MASVRPLRDHVIVRRDDAPSKIGLIWVPDAAKQQPLEGEVIAVGSGVERGDGSIRELDVKIGDRVLFTRFLDNSTKHKNDTIIREHEIIAVVSDGAIASVLSNFVLVKREKAPEKIGLLYVPDTVRAKKDNRGIVVGMGPGLRHKNGTRFPMPDCKLGERVCFREHAGYEITWQGKEYVIMRDDDVACVLEGAAA